jgi:phosphatidylglycerophosphate synthase
MSHFMVWTHTELSRAARRRLPNLPDPGPTAEFAVAAAAGAASVAGLGMILAGEGAAILPGVLAALAFYGVGTVAAGVFLHRAYPHATLGPCNLVTLIRLALTAALIVPLVAGAAAGWAIFATAAIALSLDGADGWLARRDGLVSGFGARFDMEVDSALAMILAILAWSGGSAGAVVLLLGAPRYLFAAARLALPWLRAPLPERFSRKVVCVLQLGTLIALQLPFVTQDLSGPVVGLVATALVWSFGRDMLWLWRARA